MKKGLKNNKKGFVILFAVTLSALLLAMALGVSNIALKQVKFSTNARDTNDAFFAADTGIECALFYDSTNSNNNAFTGSASMSCAGNNSITIVSSGSLWTFVLSGLGSSGQSCAKVTVDKTLLVDPTHIIFNSKGYNIGDSNCNSSNPNRVEREVEVRYRL